MFSRKNDKKPVKKTGAISSERKRRSSGTQPARTVSESARRSQPSQGKGVQAAMAESGIEDVAACHHDLTQPSRTLEMCGHHAMGLKALPCLGNVPHTCGQGSQSCAEPPRYQQCHEHGKANNEDVPPRVNVCVLEVGDPRAHSHGVGYTKHPSCEGQESGSARQAAGAAARGRARYPP